jgi:glycosyltransferase involved in cell wall biosynthesis
LPAACRLLLVGGVDESAPHAASTEAALRSAERVHAPGFLEDIRPALALADVLVLPSYREGFPNVLLQAGAMELPVIATDVNGSNEIVEPGCNGWLVPVRDAARLEAAMRAAMAMPASARAAMGARARQRVHERFERAGHWRRMLDFYRKELGEEGL